MLGDIKYQPIVVTVPSASAEVAIEADTDKLYARCTGIFASIPEDIGGLTSCTFSRVELGGKELFPDGYEIKMLTATRDVPVNERYYDLDEPARGARFKTAFSDLGIADIYPYSFVIYLRLQNK